MGVRAGVVCAVVALAAAATLASSVVLPGIERVYVPQRDHQIYAELLASASAAATQISTCGAMLDFADARAAAAALVDASSFDILAASFQGKLELQAGKLAFGGADCHYVAHAGFDSSLVLSTGTKQFANINVRVPSAQGFGQKLNVKGNADIDVVLGLPGVRVSRDCAILSVDLLAKASVQLALEYIFASEEYPADQMSMVYSDSFTVRASVNGNAFENLALTPDNRPLTVFTVNTNANPALHVDNTNGQMQLFYSGATVPMETRAVSVTAGDKLSLQIAVCDVGDDALDSGVFIKIGHRN